MRLAKRMLLTLTGQEHLSAQLYTSAQLLCARSKEAGAAALQLCAGTVCRSIAALCRHSVQEHCSCVLPGALFSSVWWFGLQLRKSDSWLSGVAAKHEEGYIGVCSLHGPEPSLS